MSKTLEEAKTALKALEGGSDLVEAVTSAILHERTTAQGIVKAEKEKMTGLFTALKPLGFDAANTDYSVFVSDIKERISAGEQAGEKLTDSEKRFKSLEKNLETITSKLTESEREKAEAKRKIDDATIRTTLSKHLNPKTISAANAHIMNLISSGNAALDENGESVIFKYGSETLDFEKGLERFKAENKDDLISNQNGGSGGGSGGATEGKNVMAKADFDKLTPEAQAAKFQDKTFELSA